MIDFYLTNKGIFDILFNLFMVGVFIYMVMLINILFKKVQKELDDHILALKREQHLLSMLTELIKMDDVERMKDFIFTNMKPLFPLYEKIQAEAMENAKDGR